MKKLLILVLAVLMVPTVVAAANVNPWMYLEVYHQADDPTDPEGPGVTIPEVCIHQRTYPVTLPCFAPAIVFEYYMVPIHVSKLDTPICDHQGPDCDTKGGFSGVAFGAAVTGGSGMTFMGLYACPVFLVGSGIPPASMTITATGTGQTFCHDWVDHPGYLVYQRTTSATTARFINLTTNAQLGVLEVVDCVPSANQPTSNGGGIQVGGEQSIVCPQSPTPVSSTTWGAIKGLYR